jgi:hypothetical protein
MLSDTCSVKSRTAQGSVRVQDTSWCRFIDMQINCERIDKKREENVKDVPRSVGKGRELYKRQSM